MTKTNSPLRLLFVAALICGSAVLAGCDSTERSTKTTTTTSEQSYTPAPAPTTSSTTTTTTRHSD